MHILFLPGYSTTKNRNKIEMHEVATALQWNRHQVIEHEWRHWEDENNEWNETIETELIASKLKSHEYNKLAIVAKSIGTQVAMSLIPFLNEKLKQVVLMGIPFASRTAEEKELYLRTLTTLLQREIPVSIIQNKKDPLGSFEDIKGFIQLEQVSMIEMDADNHSYNYPGEINELLKA